MNWLGRKKSSTSFERGESHVRSSDVPDTEYLRLAKEQGTSDAAADSYSIADARAVEILAQAAWERTRNLRANELVSAVQVRDQHLVALQSTARQLEAVSGHLERCENERALFPGTYNWLVGLLLVGVALALFLSDIPISVLLVGKGLQLPTEAQQVIPFSNSNQHQGNSSAPESDYVRRDARNEDQDAADAWRKAQQEGHFVTVADIFRRPWDALSLFWDVYVLALGLALLGFATKPILDVLLHREQYFGDRKRWAPVFVAGIAGLAFLLTSITLGYFRGDVLTEERKAPYEAIIQQSKANIAALKADPKAVTGSGANAEEKLKQLIGDEERKATDAQNSEAPIANEKLLAVLTYIAITVTLPLIGGVCFYFGFQRVDRFWNLRVLRLRYRNIRNLWQEQSTRTLKSDQIKRELQAQFEHVNSKLCLHLFKNACSAAYFDGLAAEERRLRQEMAGLSLFARMRMQLENSFVKKDRPLRPPEAA